MLDFSRINAFKQGQRDSFEELVCQLARLEHFPDGSTYRRVEGSGGDGGVESYWTLPDGQVVGYQAKYFLSTGEIDWSQIDESITQALETHPTLRRYVVALPCDLTDRAGIKKKGSPGWTRWSQRVTAWKKQAELATGSDVSFDVWTSSEIVARLSKPNASGLQEFFFGEVRLSTEWFIDRLEESILALDERFHPEDHVEVRTEKLFLAIARAPEYREEFRSNIAAVHKAVDRRPNRRTPHGPEQNLLDELAGALSQLDNLANEIGLDPQNSWSLEEWVEKVRSLEKANGALKTWYWECERSLEDKSSEKSAIHELINEAHKLDDAIEHLERFVSADYNLAEQSRVAFIRGNAGSGKSHLLARCAQSALKAERPALLILGNRLNDGELWTQIAQAMGLAGRTPDQLLGALDAAGKLVGVRALLLVDAINEGPGSRYWREHLASLIHRVRRYSHLSVIVSCRTEYFDLAVPSEIAKRGPVFTVRGFETYEEQLNAARVYLDRRGIARPSTPWLAPEFVNPLFLRSVCTSLERDGKTEFPVGLSGTKRILSYYLESVGAEITRREESAVSLAPNIRRAVLGMARVMLENKTDYLSFEACRSLLAQKFQDIRPRIEADWLSVFLRSGLLRKDPSPFREDFEDDDVVRFSFQRFQDALMAEEALGGVVDAASLFSSSGKLSFCVEGNHLAWEWRGLLSALAVAVPEKLQAELVDALPGGEDAWWDDWSVREAFAESVRWRLPSSFSDRTLELLNKCDNLHDIVVSVAVAADHPWNAEFITRNLLRRRISVRDASWTVWVNEQSDEADSKVGVLIEWCRRGQAPHSNPQNQYLAALMLCWLFTSTNRAIRDKATKALSTLLLANAGIFQRLLNSLAGVDDPYVLERLLAAAFGACCNEQNEDRLRAYADATFEHIFKCGQPPLGVLLRDYALGIIEIAQDKGVLSDAVEIEKCKPPYRSARVHLDISEERLKRVAKRAGDDSILQSASSWGDFSRYEIEPRTRRFINVPLHQAVPLTARQQEHAFDRDVIGDDKDRVRAYERLTKTANPYIYGIIAPSFPDEPAPPTKEAMGKWQRSIKAAEKALFALLSKEEIERFRAEAAPHLYQRESGPQVELNIDLAAAKRWVARRAYAFGWSTRKFPHDRDSSYSRERAKIERVGKKYQWLALDELLSRLADNNWLEGEFEQSPTVYKSPLDIGFERDIDPTILDGEQDHSAAWQDDSWAFRPFVSFGDEGELELREWPFKKDLEDGLRKIPIRFDAKGTPWLVLYEHQGRNEKYAKRQGEHGMRRQEFRFLATVIVSKAEVASIVRGFRSSQNFDMHWAVSDFTDGPFLHEAPWRGTWDQRKWIFDSWRLPSGVPFAQTVAQYHWESHLDASLPEGYSAHIPMPWLAKALNLNPDVGGVWRDSLGNDVYKELKGEERSNICLLRMDKAEALLGSESTYLTLLLAERTAWPNGSNAYATWRRTEGVMWAEDARRVRSSSWTRDARNEGGRRAL